MAKQILINQLRLGKNGKQILAILESISNGSDVCESSQDSASILDEIQF